MIETKDITKMVAHIIRRDNGIADPQLMHPTREWFIGLSITTLIVLLGSWFCFYIYTHYAQTIDASMTVSEPVVPYQAATISEAIKIYETKQLKFSEILGSGSEKGFEEIGTTTSPAVTDEILPVSVNAEPGIVFEEEPLMTDDSVSGTPVLAL